VNNSKLIRIRERKG